MILSYFIVFHIIYRIVSQRYWDFPLLYEALLDISIYCSTQMPTSIGKFCWTDVNFLQERSKKGSREGRKMSHSLKTKRIKLSQTFYIIINCGLKSLLLISYLINFTSHIRNKSITIILHVLFVHNTVYNMYNKNTIPLFCTVIHKENTSVE